MLLARLTLRSREKVLHGQFKFGLVLLSLPLERSFADQFLYASMGLKHVGGYGCPSLDELALQLMIERLLPTVGCEFAGLPRAVRRGPVT